MLLGNLLRNQKTKEKNYVKNITFLKFEGIEITDLKNLFHFLNV